MKPPNRRQNAAQFIKIRGAQQNNLKDLSVDFPIGKVTAITGPSGSGKSSLALDTLYAEGQRRYVETFSSYARQFLDRLDRPKVGSIEGIPPAIAIDQVNPVRTSRSTVGTMSELADHLHLLYARFSSLFCRQCGQPVRQDEPQSVVNQLLANKSLQSRRIAIGFAIRIPREFTANEIESFLLQQGYAHILERKPSAVVVAQDRLRVQPNNRSRLAEAVEIAFARGDGQLSVHLIDSPSVSTPLRYSQRLHCAYCNLEYAAPTPALFSFNSPLGACPECRGFGRIQGIDYGLVVPDQTKTLAEGAIRPWQSPSYGECQNDLVKFAKRRNISLDTAWQDLDEAARNWVIDGEGDFAKDTWYGVSRFFRWLETKSYRMHIRILLSRYRAYSICPTCNGARLRHEALNFRLGTGHETKSIASARRFRSSQMQFDDETLKALPGLTIHDINRLPLNQTRDFFQNLRLPEPMNQAARYLLQAIRARLEYLNTVGVGYLSLDRQSRTLSGGEVQRINLTTALGTTLVNTLFVLDEPSIGLHEHDIERMITVLRHLSGAGNTLVVVEHNPKILMSADRLMDLGPGPGEKGGNVCYFGPPGEITSSRSSVTGPWLAGRQTLDRTHTTPPDSDTNWLRFTGVTAQNLRNIDVEIPMHRLVCLTGVSGSGKSTLLEQVIYRGLRKHFGLAVETPGPFHSMQGAEVLDQVILVDQSPIGKTTRSTPASYTGAFSAIRSCFSKTPLAQERGYRPGQFSFNSGNGRCPTCGGTGFERIEMQFLSDIYLRCPDCDGLRYRQEILDVHIEREEQLASISDVLAMTVNAARDFFSTDPQVLAGLKPLLDVGLGYLRLGQPVPTLSGGEAQRLKLAARLANVHGEDHTLFLLDEPTSGLSLSDTAVLLSALNRLVELGHSLLVIEHNLNFVAASDWIIDLGPEGGENGGHVVATGPASAIATSHSYTGQALRKMNTVKGTPTALTETSSFKPAAPSQIKIINAQEHNLRGIDVSVPLNKFTVITGLSGSGKSTLAFDIIFAEGQRRYLESLNAYARTIVAPASRPEVDSITGIPPTVAIGQHTSRGGWKSTVGTLTEIHHYLRLLYVRLGIAYCPTCGVKIESQSKEGIFAQILRKFQSRTIEFYAPLVKGRKGHYARLAEWAAQRNHPYLRVDGELISTEHWARPDRFKEHDIDLPIAKVKVLPTSEVDVAAALGKALAYGNGLIKITSTRNETLYSVRRACPKCDRSFPEPDPRLFSYNSKHGWCPSCTGTGILTSAPKATSDETQGPAVHTTCPSCGGKRLCAEALCVRFYDRSIAELSSISITELSRWFKHLSLDERSRTIASDVISEVEARLHFLINMGLDYLSLDRSAPTLSGGESQRIRLAAQLGSNLRGVCYVLDEPTIGLHSRDHTRLVNALKSLCHRGNTVVVVEHDEYTIRAADHVIDLGPGAGAEGGQVVACGTINDLAKAPESITGAMLIDPPHHPQFSKRKIPRSHPCLNIRGATLNNLHQREIRVPLQRFVCITGVSGSGKSSLMNGIIAANLVKILKTGSSTPVTDFLGCQSITGYQPLSRVLSVDQSPIGRTPRSCPATYIGVFAAIRRLYAQTPEARLRGFSSSRFSFNNAIGRCPECAGQGFKRIEMSFMPDVSVTCEVCGGKRYNDETLAVKWKGQSIADVLDMDARTACEFFSAQRQLHSPLSMLVEVGLGYLQLGQQSPTLSGGEAQRIKLVSELLKADSFRLTPTLYLLDEPTVGLHIADVERLCRTLHRLVEAGHSVLVVEHNLDLIAESDWVLDLGPEGGKAGGRVVANGPPEQIRKRMTPTGRALDSFLKGHSTKPS